MNRSTPTPIVSVFRIVVSTIVFALFAVSISAQPDPDTDALGANKALVIGLIETVFNQADVEAAGEYVTAEYLQNTPGVESGLPALQFAVQMFHTAFPDIRYTVTHIAAQDDLVAARLLITGTQEGEFMGIPATGRKVAAYAVNFWRVEDGLLAEHWEVLDTLSFLQQLGVIPGGAEATEAQQTPEVSVTEEAAVEIDSIEANTALIERLFSDVVNVQDAAAAEGIIAPDFVWYTGFAAPGLEGFQQFYLTIFEAFPDVNRTPVLTVAEGDLVFVYNTITGTHEGGEQLYGVPPTGNPINYTSADIFRVQDGLIVELWDTADYVTLFGQIGLMGAGQ